MKIAIYGVSRSGKDYTISAVVDHLNRQQSGQAYHLKGSKTINQLSLAYYGISFKQCSEEQKHQLRQAFIDVLNAKANQYEVVFVDGHYAFMNNIGGFDVVFTEEDRTAYDAFFYLDTLSANVVKYARSSKGEKRNTRITEVQIRQWKRFERHHLGLTCQKMGKELMVFDGDTEPTINFLCRFIADRDGSQFDPQVIARRLIDTIPELKHYHHVVLLDCDKTVSEVDLSAEHAELCGIHREQLKAIFRNDRYSAYQFERVAKLYQGCAEHVQFDVALTVGRNPRLSRWLHYIIRGQTINGLIVGITAGEHSVWLQVLQQHSPFHHLIGHNRLEPGSSHITPAVKRAVALELRTMGKTVIAYGDSLIDIPMLEAANRGYLVAHNKLNQPVLAHLALTPRTALRQYCGQYLYPNITIEPIHTLLEAI